MYEMTPEQHRAFLLEGTRTGKLATTRDDGRPHVMPIWFVLDDAGAVMFNTGAETVKGRNLRGTGRAMLCVDDDTPPFAFATVEGTVEISDDPGELLTWATRIGARYMGAERAEEFGRRNAAPGELLVRLHPDRVLGQGALAE